MARPREGTNGSAPHGTPAPSTRPARMTLAPEVETYLERRTEAFQRATMRKGLPTTWGTGVRREDFAPAKPKKPAARRSRRSG